MRGVRSAKDISAAGCITPLNAKTTGHRCRQRAHCQATTETLFHKRTKTNVLVSDLYLWVIEMGRSYINTIIDERGSLAVANPLPGPLANLLCSIRKLPARVALTGDVVPLKDEKVQFAAESLREAILSEQKAISEASYSVSGILSSSSIGCTSRSENLQDLLDGGEPYTVYRFKIRSCTYLDSSGGTQEVDLEDIEASKADLLSPFSAKVIDGINQSEARRRALMLFCFVYLNANARDAFVLSIDRKGFDVLGKVPSLATRDGFCEYQWKEFRFSFKEEAHDIETFCRLLVEMEEEALKNVSSYSGLG
ncbi:hypothetical protein HHK36_010975 [Tetracentron sinense]|uniref:DUF2470 domain-containing protein n=1 Tax=Tetracentron sinense TaxID=13715 RepID=A0A835DGT3_TETSI|nr:hypothetical protein HHK36_010975 [Tetracentron sinense]